MVIEQFLMTCLAWPFISYLLQRRNIGLAPRCPYLATAFALPQSYIFLIDRAKLRELRFITRQIASLVVLNPKACVSFLFRLVGVCDLTYDFRCLGGQTTHQV